MATFKITIPNADAVACLNDYIDAQSNPFQPPPSTTMTLAQKKTFFLNSILNHIKDTILHKRARTVDENANGEKTIRKIEIDNIGITVVEEV